MPDDPRDKPTTGDIGLQTPMTAPTDFPTVIRRVDAPPEQIGPYKVLQTLGEGGMGVVYLAEQRTPIHRRVALKVVKAGMDTKEVVARFEAERQALAALDHPNIARVYDAGATEAGRPFFAMEHVQGVPITQYCDTHRLHTNDRLELFGQVCDAVQHAHQNAIIHRDLKPSNILVMLVGDKPVPKVIDFGVAKATNRSLTDKTVYTEIGQLIGTPEYMSPEQAEMTGLSIDTRADIYSLGVILYELLVGALPFDSGKLRAVSLVEVQRIIRDEEPPLLSTRLGTMGGDTSLVATKRSTDAATLSRELRGDLDWIVAKAMEKDRNRRYSSASELWADIQRHLNDEPVVARPPSAAYRMQKFARRHRAGVAAGAFVTLALMGGVAATAWQAIRATRAEKLADVRRAQAETEAKRAAANFAFVRDMLASADPDALGRDVKVRDVLDDAATRVEGAYKDEPEVEASVRSTLGNTYRALGLFEQSEPQLSRTLTLRRERLGDNDPDTLAAEHDLGVLLRESSGRLQDAETNLRAAMNGRARVLGEDNPATLESMGALAEVLRREGRYKDAEELARKALDGRRKLGEKSAGAYDAMNALATVLRSAGKLDEAEKLLREAVEGQRDLLGEEHTETLRSMNQLASLLKDRGRNDDAEKIFREVLEIRRRKLGETHVQTLTSMNQLALVLQRRDEFSEAEQLLRTSLEGYRSTLGEDNQGAIVVMSNLARLLQRTDRLKDAEPLLRRCVELSRRVLGERNPTTLISMNNLAGVLLQLGQTDAAIDMYRQTLDAHVRVFGATHVNTLAVMNGLGNCLVEAGKYQDAEQPLTKSYEALRAAKGDADPRTAHALGDLVNLYEKWGKPDKAAELRARLPKGDPKPDP